MRARGARRPSRGPAEVVVAALDVQAHEQHVARDPAQVLAVFGVAAGLPLEPDFALTEARVAGFEQLAKPGEPLHGSIPLRWQSTHSLSLKMRRCLEALELAFPRLRPLGSPQGPSPEVMSRVDHESQLLAVMLVDQRSEAASDSCTAYRRSREGSAAETPVRALEAPFVIIPGDNEWWMPPGGMDPMERLARFRELFESGDTSLVSANQARAAIRPLRRIPRAPALDRGNVLFVGLNVQGSNNNLGRTARWTPSTARA